MRTALAFSGGKDSWACLLLNRFKLDNILVIWVNTGKTYPEIIETVAKAKEMCPHFVELIVDREGQNAFHGMPSDIVPVCATRDGQTVTEQKGPLVQSYINCCYENIALNIETYCKTHGVEEIICGQKNADAFKSTSRDGTVINGIKRIMPIELWTEDEVRDYVKKHIELPAHFDFKHTSMDCYDCTAYTKDTKDIREYAKLNHPILHSEYLKRRAVLDQVIHNAIEEYHVQ